jgi:predicted protein tyrosine phosphatase
VLFHCHAGVSRSPAACLIALALHEGVGGETRAFEALLRITRKPWPNLRMVRVADHLLGLDGRLVAPVEAYQKAFPERLGAYRRLNRRRGLHSPVARFA